MKCKDGIYNCSNIGISGKRECCGLLLAVGETKFLNGDSINGACPLEAQQKNKEEISTSNDAQSTPCKHESSGFLNYMGTHYTCKFCGCDMDDDD